MNEPWLIQTCRFKNIELSEVDGFDSAFSLEYMGKAEFEFGALPASLREVCSALDKYDVFETPYKNNLETPFYLFCTKESKDEILGYLEKLLNKEIRPAVYIYLKENMKFTGLDPKAPKKRGRKPKGYVAPEPVPYFSKADLWWDVSNCWFLTMGELQVTALKTALQNLRSKWIAEGKIPNS